MGWEVGERFRREGTCLCVLAAQLCQILCDPTDHSLPGPSVLVILSYRRGNRPREVTEHP